MLTQEELIRKLAKSNKYQTLFTYFKESGVQFFRNNTDYTQIQITFLNWLNFYSTIYLDIALDYVSEIVLENNTYEDAYFYYKSKNKTKMYEEKTKKVSKKDKNIETQTTGSFTWVMKNKPSKK